jgi:hypothetical protein
MSELEQKEVFELINDFFQYEYDHNPYEINFGHCYHWAYLAYKLLGGNLWYNSMHAVLELDGIFYDSEHLDGIDFEFIPYNDLEDDIFISCSENDFINYWDDNGNNCWDQTLISSFELGEVA